MTNTTDQLPTEIAPTGRLLTAAEFHRLADVPPEVEWFANLSNPHTRRVYENAVKDFMRFTGITRPEEFPPSHARISLPGATTWCGAGSAAAPYGTGSPR